MAQPPQSRSDLFAAATAGGPCAVEAVLQRLVMARQRWDDSDVEPWLALPPTTAAPALAPPIIDLSRYDQLLTEVRDVAA